MVYAKEDNREAPVRQQALELSPGAPAEHEITVFVLFNRSLHRHEQRSVRHKPLKECDIPNLQNFRVTL